MCLLNIKRLTAIHQQLKKKIQTETDLHIDVHRSNVFADSYSHLKKISPDGLLQNFSINLIDEDNSEQKITTREWLNLIVDEMIDPENKLFVPSANESGFQPNTMSNIREHHLEYFKFSGQIIALAIINDIPVNAHFTPFFLKHILHRPVTFKDLEDTDQELYSSLQELLNNDSIPSDRYFTICVKNIGLNMLIELKPNGTQIKVTNNNKQEFVKLVTNYYLIKSIKEQIKSFREGFESLIHQDEINNITPKDLDLLICGIIQIDLDNLKQNTIIIKPYTSDSPVIKYFFDAISKWDGEDLAKLILFITGSSFIPDGGFQTFRKIGRPLSIRMGGFKESLPVAHTRFNMLDLPDYESEEQLDQKLKVAIQEIDSIRN